MNMDSPQNESGTSQSPQSERSSAQDSDIPQMPGTPQPPSKEAQLAQLEMELKQALLTYKMIMGFRDAVRLSNYPGKVANEVAQGIGFLNNIVSQSMAHQKFVRQRIAQVKNGDQKPEATNGKAT